MINNFNFNNFINFRNSKAIDFTKNIFLSASILMLIFLSISSDRYLSKQEKINTNKNNIDNTNRIAYIYPYINTNNNIWNLFGVDINKESKYKIIYTSTYVYVRSKFVFIDDKLYILNKKLTPGRYMLYGTTNNIKNMNFFYIKTYKLDNISKIKQHIRNKIFLNTLNFKESTRSVILTLVLCEKLNKKLKYIYNLGIGHYLAFSGLHINILFVALSYFSNSLSASIYSFILLLLYSLLIMSPSIFRALLFLLFKILADILNEERSRIKEFCITLILALSMFGHNSIALHFSFASSLIIILFYRNRLLMICLINFVTSIQSLYFFGYCNLFSIIPNVLLSYLFHIIILLSFTILFIPVGYILEISIDLLLYLTALLDRYCTYIVEYQLSYINLYIFYLFTAILFGIIYKTKQQKRERLEKRR